MQTLSKDSAAAGYTGDEGDMIAACDLADDLRDAIVEYQVSTDLGRRTLDGWLMQIVALPTGGNLRAELQVDRELHSQRFDEKH